MPQTAVAVVFAVGTFVLILIFGYVAVNAGSGPDSLDEIYPITHQLQWLLFGNLLLVATVALSLTLPRLPYTAARLGDRSTAAAPLIVTVMARQYVWQMAPLSIPAGQLIRFDLTSQDVNHDFAIYDPGNRILAQAQAMPGYKNSLLVRFEKPGAYRVRCLELCGQLHQAMIMDLCVGACGT